MIVHRTAREPLRETADVALDRAARPPTTSGARPCAVRRSRERPADRAQAIVLGRALRRRRPTRLSHRRLAVHVFTDPGDGASRRTARGSAHRRIPRRRDLEGLSRGAKHARLLCRRSATPSRFASARRTSVPIAIVGAGEIADLAHLPAYAAHGLKILGIFDLQRASAPPPSPRGTGFRRVYRLARRAGARTTTSRSWTSPFTRGSNARSPRRCSMSGKHLLCQKPLSYDFDEAARLVRLAAERASAMLAVNQQLRYSESVAAARRHDRARLDRRSPSRCAWDFHVYTPWENWPWVAAPAAARPQPVHDSLHRRRALVLG